MEFDKFYNLCRQQFLSGPGLVGTFRVSWTFIVSKGSDRPKAEFTEDRRFGRRLGQPNLRTLPKIIFADSKNNFVCEGYVDGPGLKHVSYRSATLKNYVQLFRSITLPCLLL